MSALAPRPIAAPAIVSGPAPLTRRAVLLAAVAAAVLLFLATRTTLWDRDEPRFAESAREMLVSGNLLVPTFDGDFRPHKPPLLTWLMAAAMSLLGPTELAARLPSAVGFALALLFTFDAGRTLLSARVGLLAASFLATSPLALLEGGAATADAVLLAATTALLAVVARAAERGVTAGLVLAFGFASALGQLAKGPVALVLPLVAFGGALVFRREAFPDRRRLALLLGAGSALGLGSFLSWAIPCDRATGGRLFTEGFGTHVLGRSLAPMEGHGGGFFVSLPYYAPVLLVGFLPWLFPLRDGLRKEARAALLPRSKALLLAAALVPFVFFTLVATKLPHYVLPAWPALALLAASAVERRGSAPRVARIAAGVAAVEVALFLVVVPRVDASKPVPPLAAEIRALTDPSTPVATCGFAEPSLDFYLARPPIERLATAADLALWSRRGEAGVVVATRPMLAAARAKDPTLPLVEIASRSGLDVAHGRWVELVAARRREARP